MPFARTPSFWNNFREIAQSLLYEKERTCLLCDTRIPVGKEICPICEQSYFHPELGRCVHCGKLIPRNHIECQDCREGRGPRGLDKVVAWGHYTGGWREYIQAVKFKSQPYRLKRIAQTFADWSIKNLPPPDFLVPVPMPLERLAERGFNQASGIASLLHWELGIPLIEALERTSMSVPQVGLSRSERLHNLKGAFKLAALKDARVIRDARIWLVDDVTTTGTTLEACAAELRRGGAREVFGLTLAAGIEKGLK